MNHIYVTILERSKSLYDMGVRVKSEFLWLEFLTSGRISQEYKLVPSDSLHIYEEEDCAYMAYPAYLTDELMAMLPPQIFDFVHYDLTYTNSPANHKISYIHYAWHETKDILVLNKSLAETNAKTLPNALALMVETVLHEKWLDLKAINGGKQ